MAPFGILVPVQKFISDNRLSSSVIFAERKEFTTENREYIKTLPLTG
jgi:hypothetical protein